MIYSALKSKFIKVVSLCYLIGLLTSFEAGLGAIVVVTLISTLWNLTNGRELIYLLPLLCIDPVSKIFLSDYGIRFHTLNYILSISTVVILFRRKLSIKPLLPYLLFILWMVFGLIYSTNFFNGFISLWSVLSFLAFYLIFYDVFCRSHGSTILLNAFFNGLFVSLLVSILFYQKYGLDYFSSNTYKFFSFDYVNPNTFIHMPVLGSICSLLFYLRTKVHKKVHIIIQFILLTCSAFSGSRSGLVMCILIFSVTFFSIKNLKWAFMTLALILILVAQNVDILKNSNIFGIKRFSIIFDTERKVESKSSGRTEIMRIGIEILKSNPLIGLGTGSFSTAFSYFTANNREFSTFFFKSAGSRMQAHSQYIKTLVENGWIGFILLLNFLYSIFKSKKYSSTAIIATLLIIISLSFSEFSAKTLLFFAAFSLVQSSYFQWDMKLN